MYNQNVDIYEVITKINELEKEKKEILEKDSDSITALIVINLLIFVFLDVIAFAIGKSFNFPISILNITAVATSITLGTANLFGTYKKSEKQKNKINMLNNQLDYLKELQKECKKSFNKEKELNEINSKTSNIKIDNINYFMNWKKELRLIRDYNLNKKAYIKAYKKGTLNSKLSKKGYPQDEISDICEKVQGDISKQKVLKKNKN